MPWSQRSPARTRYLPGETAGGLFLASKPYGTPSTGVTSNLATRVEAHRNGSVEGFTRQYGVHTLVYFEVHAGMYEAIQREKRLKKRNRAWKIRLIEEMNPGWKDLSEQAF